MTTISYPPPSRTPSILETDKTTVEHEAEIEIEEWFFELLAYSKANQQPFSEKGLFTVFSSPCQEVPKYLASWDLVPLAQSLAKFPYGDDSALDFPMSK